LSNQVAILLGLCLIGSIAYDYVYNELAWMTAFGRYGVVVLENIAFWR